MKRGLTIGLAIAVAGITYSYVSARSFKSEPARAELRPASEIVDTVREMGLAPNSEVLRQGPYYVLHALDPHGVELRVVADAHFGDILSVRLAQPYSLAPNYVRAPRIIHVPQPRDEPSKIDGDAKGTPKQHAPPQRAVQSAPPSDALLTPIRPTPNFGAKPAPAKKSGPPPASTPPTAAPKGG